MLIIMMRYGGGRVVEKTKLTQVLNPEGGIECRAMSIPLCVCKHPITVENHSLRESLRCTSIHLRRCRLAPSSGGSFKITHTSSY